jgi:hypothetical protein
MRLGLSREAALEAPLDELIDACVRRGLSDLELALDPRADSDDVLEQVHAVRLAGLRVSGLVTDATFYAHELSLLSRVTHVPVIVRAPDDVRERVTFARSIAAHGGSALLLARGPAESWLDHVAASRVPFVWQVDHTCPDPVGDAARIQRAGLDIGYVRLVGGGPEAAMQEGRGIGPLMGTLALSGFAGALILTPSSQRYRVAWAAWLGRRGGWGCGSKADRERELVALQF